MNQMRAGFFLLFHFLFFFITLFPMYMIIEGGYRLNTASFEPAGWLFGIGVSDKFGDEIVIDTTFNLNASTTINPSPTNYFLFDVDLSIPILGRDEDSWIKAGPFLSIEYGNFSFFNSTSTNWKETTWIGAFASLKFEPWEITIRGEYPVTADMIMEGETPNVNIADLFEVRLRFYLTSFFRNFVDKLVMEFLLSTRERKISISFMEPF